MEPESEPENDDLDDGVGDPFFGGAHRVLLRGLHRGRDGVAGPLGPDTAEPPTLSQQ